MRTYLLFLILVSAIVAKAKSCGFHEYKIIRDNKYTCIRCPDCPPMMQPEHKCGELDYVPKKIKCEFCPPNTYKSYYGSFSCRLCSKCIKNQEEVRGCSKKDDRICGDCKPGYCMSADYIECVPCSRNS